MAGRSPPDWVQGRSWEPLLEGKDVDWREDFLYEWFEDPAVHCARKHRGVRTGRWKLIHFWEMPDEWALYDLKEDPDEMVNLVDDPQHAELVARLKKRITQLRAETGRSEEHTSELQSLMRNSYAVFCLKKKKETQTTKIIAPKDT